MNKHISDTTKIELEIPVFETPACQALTGNVFDLISDYYHHQREHSSLNKILLDDTIRQLLSKRKYSRVLDVGCGIGTYCRMLKSYSSEIIGLDTNNKMLDFARSRKDGILYINQDFLTIEEDRKYDLIIFSLILDHVENFQTYLVKAREILSCKGKVFCVIPNPVKDSCFQHDEFGCMLTSYFIEARQKKYRRNEKNQIFCEIFSFKRTLSTYLNASIAAGLSLTNIVEPRHPDINHPAHHVPYFTILEFLNERR